MQTHKRHFQLLDKETEKVVKQNNKTAAWWQWRQEPQSFGSVGGFVPTAKRGEMTSQNGTFQCSGSPCCCSQLNMSNPAFGWKCCTTGRACARTTQWQWAHWIMHRPVCFFKAPFQSAFGSIALYFISYLSCFSFFVLIRAAQLWIMQGLNMLINAFVVSCGWRGDMWRA